MVAYSSRRASPLSQSRLLAVTHSRCRLSPWLPTHLIVTHSPLRVHVHIVPTELPRDEPLALTPSPHRRPSAWRLSLTSAYILTSTFPLAGSYPSLMTASTGTYPRRIPSPSLAHAPYWRLPHRLPPLTGTRLSLAPSFHGLPSLTGACPSLVFAPPVQTLIGACLLIDDCPPAGAYPLADFYPSLKFAPYWRPSPYWRRHLTGALHLIGSTILLVPVTSPAPPSYLRPSPR